MTPTVRRKSRRTRLGFGMKTVPVSTRHSATPDVSEGLSSVIINASPCYFFVGSSPNTVYYCVHVRKEIRLALQHKAVLICSFLKSGGKTGLYLETQIRRQHRTFSSLGPCDIRKVSVTKQSARSSRNGCLYRSCQFLEMPRARQKEQTFVLINQSDMVRYVLRLLLSSNTLCRF